MLQYHLSNFFSIFSQVICANGLNIDDRLKENSQNSTGLFGQTMQSDDFILSEEFQEISNAVMQNLEELYSNLYNSISNNTNANMQARNNEIVTGMYQQYTQPKRTNGMQGHRGHRRGVGLGQFNHGFPQANNNWGNQQVETPKPQLGMNNWEINIGETPNTPTIDTPTVNIPIVDTPIYIPSTNNQNNTTQSEFDINESIEYSQQGYIGDCWLLSGLNSLSYTEKGQKLIDDIITSNDDGSYTVSFSGVNANVTVTQDDLRKARQSGLYSSGDDDVLLMELATEQILDEVQSGNIKIKGDTTNLSFINPDEGQISSLDGGWLSDMIYLLTGEDVEFITNKSSFTQFLDEMEENPDDYVAKLSFPSSSEGESRDYNTITDIYGNVIYELGSGGHAFAIKSVSNGVVTIVNPHDSSIEYEISYDELIYSARNIEYYEL